jgi:hypothetical protein
LISGILGWNLFQGDLDEFGQNVGRFDSDTRDLWNTDYHPDVPHNMAGSQVIAWNVQMAGSLITALPTLLVYIFLGRYFLRGLLTGALKG